MKFISGSRRRAVEYEKDVLHTWKENNVFEASIENRPIDSRWVFYDGPPFLTGTPHHGHLLISTVKDTMGRFHTMQGQRVDRRWGWDCHGLPAELFVEKKLGIANKKEVGVKISVVDYVKECRSVMVKTGTEWEDAIDRIGRWVEFKGAYQTMDKEYMESVWWAFKELYDKGKIYDGEKILVYCTKDATPISKSEVAMENSYKTVTDPSVYVYFQLEGSDDKLLAWTTTPWTLPANVAVAVNTSIEYSLLKHNTTTFYVATDAIDRVMQNEKHEKLEYTVVKKVMGKDLVGLKYHPLFENHGPQAHKVLAASFVTSSDGTGIVHEAPAYGEEDYELCKSANIPVVAIVDENGNYTAGRWLGENIWDINKHIAKTLVEEGTALKVEYIQHEYPHCHRCGTKLMYRAHPSWFMDIQAQKPEMLAALENTSWTPSHLQEGRFKNIIESAPDWNLSRDRFWATPIPVWKGERNDGTTVVKVFGSYDEFEEFSGVRLDDYHLPQVMGITFELDGATMHHIGKVLDCWFESGSMPFAQFHYPFENKTLFQQSYPADFIVEAIDQTRGWFYSLMAVNVGLFGTAPFKNLICTGFINAADGKKMSKKLKNYTDPIELMNQYSADSFRMLMLNSPLTNGEDFALADKDVADMARKLSMIWNVFDFFTMYAEVDGWQWNGNYTAPTTHLNLLDTWILSKVHALLNDVENATLRYDLQSASRFFVPFLDDLSNWYVRRSRKRFWKSENTHDKDAAYATLHYVMVVYAHALAPFAPFMADELFQKLTGEPSVHLRDWPRVVNVISSVMPIMDAVRAAVNEGLSQRAKAKIKVRQPLSSVRIESPVDLGTNSAEYIAIMQEELNVHEVDWVVISGPLTIALDITLNDTLLREGVAREIVRFVQQARKDAGLDVDDRIELTVASDSPKIVEAVAEHKDYILQETLAVTAVDSMSDGFSSHSVINGSDVTISLRKSK